MDYVSESEHKGWRLVGLIYGLYVLGLVIGVGLIVGVILAHLKEDKVATPEINSHLREQIRLFWTGLAIFIIGFLTSFILIGLVIWAVGYIWLIWRLIKGGIAAMDRAPIEGRMA